MDYIRRIILFVLLLIGAFGMVAYLAIGLQPEDLLGESWFVVLMVYVLVIGILIGVEFTRRFPGPVAKPVPIQAVAQRRGSFERQYYEAIYERYRDIEVVGVSRQQLTLEQEEVFEPPLLSADQSAGPSAAPQEIWAHLQVPPHKILPTLFKPPRQQRHFAILGKPGSGKSTLLQHVALFFARRRHLTLSPPIRELTPILFRLRERLETIKQNPQIGLDQLAAEQARERLRVTARPAWLAQRLRRGQCIVMLDGLDEVADEQDRRRIAAWVERQLARFPDNYFLISSRPHGYYSNRLPNVAVLTVEGFTVQQVEQYVRKWYLATELKSVQRDDVGVRARATEQADDLIRRLNQTPVLTALSPNPLLLTMIATVHRYLHRLPERRSELYKEIFEVFLNRRRSDNLTSLQRQRVLGPLAYRMMHNRQPQIDSHEAISEIEQPLRQVNTKIEPTTFLKRIEELSGLILESEANVYSFAHLTYQEYLAAVYINYNRLSDELLRYINDDWWHETILLYVAQDDATDLLNACMDQAAHSELALSLGIRILDEANSIRPEMRERFITFLEQSFAHGDPKRRRLIAEALLAYNLNHFALLDEREQRSICTMLISRPAYQCFLDEQAIQQAHFFHPDHWHELDFPVAADPAQAPILGVRKEDAEAFCHWLTDRTRDGFRYRLPTSSEGKEYQTELGARARYWVSDGVQRISGDRWVSPPEWVRSILAEQLFNDRLHLQLFSLGLLVNQIRSEARSISSRYHDNRNLVADIETVQQIGRLSRLLGDLTIARERAVGYQPPPLFLRLADVARFVQDKAELAEDRLRSAQKFALESDRALKRSDQERARATGDRSGQFHSDALDSVRQMDETLRDLRNDMREILGQLPPLLCEPQQVAYKVQQVIESAGIMAIGALAAPLEILQTHLLADVREHIYLNLDAGHFHELAQNGAAPLDYSYAVECAQIFARTTRIRPSRLFEERTFLRYWAFIGAMLWIGRSLNNQQTDGNRTQRDQGLRFYRSLYVDLVLLEERINGRIPPVEGIRLVREPRF